MEYKLTSAQQLYNTEVLTGNLPVWNRVFYALFDCGVSCEEISNALNEIVKENSMFRTTFFKNADGQVMQRINEFTPQNYECLTFETKAEFETFARFEVDVPTLLCENAYKFYVIKIGSKCGCLLRIHHALCDGFCIRIIIDKIKLKLNLIDKENDICQYENHLKYEYEYINSPRYSRSINYWNKKLEKGFSNLIYNFNSSEDYSLSSICYNFEQEKINIAKDICQKSNIPFSSFVYLVYAIYVNKIVGLTDFSVGMPIINRLSYEDMHTLGLYMHILPLIIHIDENSILLSIIENIYDCILELTKHQRFTETDINKNCNCGKSQRFYDVIVNYYPEQFSADCEQDMFYSSYGTSPLEIRFVENYDSNFSLQVYYRKAFFQEKDIDELFDYFNIIIDAFNKNPNSAVKNISLKSTNKINDDEIEKINKYNNTKVEYPNQSIKELFEEKAEQNASKIAVNAIDKSLTYQELNEEANKIANSLIEKGIQAGDIVPFMLPRKSYLFSTILGIIKTGATYLPIDPDYPQDRIEYMLSDSGAKLCITEENITELLNNSNTQNPNINIHPESACYCIYTSGSTGMPKGTLISHKNVANYICNNQANQMATIFKENGCNNVLSITTVSFDIFVSESFLPLCNDMTIILADEEQSKNQSKLNEISADAIQTTPTKMRMLIANKNQLDYLKKLKVIILGGEAVDTETVNKLKAITNARIYNFYGPTETTVWSTSYEITDVNDITIGKPIANTQIYIVDENMQLAPIGVTGELCIAGDGVCLGYHNKPELTAEKFFDNPFGEGKLYKTGDIAYWREDGNIIYVGRNDFQVKVRGLRIELGEIENAINGIDGVEQSVVVVRKDNEDRQILCAFYTGEELTVSEIKKATSVNLPQYMIPHIIKHIDEMPTTNNGKLDRNALPEIDLDDIESSVEYVEARTKKENVVVKSIQKALNLDRVSTLDNFFDIGGDSLKSIELIAKLEENGYTLNPREIFSALNIKELAEKIEEKANVEETVEYDSVLPGTDAQMRVYSAQLMDEGSTLYNIPYAFKVKELDVDKLQSTVNKLIERHEILRTHFENKNGEIYQVIDEQSNAIVQNLSSDDVTEFNKPFDLTKSPLFRIGYYENTVMVDFHHIIADGKSLPIFFKELNELYMGRELKIQPKQYGEFTITSSYTEENKKYWINEYVSDILTLDLNTDYPRTSKRSFEGKVLYSFIDTELHRKITEKCIKLGITNYVYYISAFSILMSKYSGNNDVIIGTPSNGRSSRFVHSLGMFVNTLALRTQPKSNKTVNDFLSEIKSISLNAIENQSYPYGELVKELGITTRDRNPLFDVMFAYQAEQLTEIIFADEKCELLEVEQSTSKEDLSFHVLPRENDVVLMAEYCTKLFKHSTIERFVKSFNLILEQMLDENKLIKNISAVVDTDLILNQFNATSHEYNIEQASTLYSLFEKTAKENADDVCVIANGKSITFGELLRTSEALDCTIRNKVNHKSIIAVIADRSIEMYSAIYGIIRGSNAYLPIDPNNPQDRIDYILENSGAELVVAQGKYVHLAGKTLCIEMTDFIENTPTFDEIPPCSATEEDTAYVIYTSGSTGQPKGAKISHKSAINRIAWMHDFYPLGKDNVILQKTPYTFDVSVWELFWWGMFGGKLVASKPNEHFVPEKILEEVENNKVTHLHFVPSVFDVFLSYLEKNTDEVDKFNSVKHVFLSGEALTANLIKRFYELYDYENVKLHNLYGPTECAVDVTYYDCKPSDVDPVPIGKPIYNTQMYVLDMNMNPLPIGVTGELHIGGVNVGQGYLNNEKLTTEKFVENPFGEGKLYKTGDLAYWREDGNIVYVGRNDFQVKVRGLRIELGEIENAINSIKGIEWSVVVIKKDNDDGQILCAFYTGEELTASEIKKSISTKLPQYMVPHIIKHIDSMPITDNGKLDRNALPEIDLDNIESSVEYVEAQTEEEKVLVKAVQKVLNLDRVSTLDNFFDIGGDSIRAIYVVSEINSNGYEIPVHEFMQSNTLGDAASKLALIEQRSSYEQGEVCGLVPFSTIMNAYYQSNPQDIEHFTHSVIMDINCDEDVIKQAVDVIVKQHDILRSKIVENGLCIKSFNDDNLYSFESIERLNYETAKEEIIEKNIRFEENSDNLVNVIFCKTNSSNILRLTIHHFVVDLVSWEIIVSDLKSVIGQIASNEEINLPKKTISFKQWIDELNDLDNDEANSYWENIELQLDNAIPLATTSDITSENEKFSISIGKELTSKLESNVSLKVRTNELLMSAFLIAAKKLGSDNPAIYVESHGRLELNRSISTDRTVGWFTALYPIIVDVNDDVTNVLMDVKDNYRNSQKYVLSYLANQNKLNDNVNVIFNYYKNTTLNEDEVLFKGGSAFPGKICVDCIIANEKLQIDISVSQCNHSKGIAKDIAVEFEKQIENLIRECENSDRVVSSISDYSDSKLTREELNEIQNTFKENEIMDVYELTPSQKGIYAQCFKDEGTEAYQLQEVIRINNAVDVDLIKESIDLIAFRHDVLNTAFMSLNSGRLVQVVLKKQKSNVSVIENNCEFEQDILDKIVETDLNTNIDITKGSMIRVTIVTFNNVCYLVCHFHHLVIDGWCLPLIIRDIQKYYSKILEGNSIESIKKEIQLEKNANTSYSKYAKWINEQNKEIAHAYWKELLDGYSCSNLLGKTPISKKTIERFSVNISDELSNKIDDFAKSNKITLNSVYESAFGLMLQKYSGSNDVVFDKIISGRSINLENISNTVGLFINTVPNRLNTNSLITLKELLDIIQNQNISANENGIISLNDIYKLCDIKSNEIQSAFVFENYLIEEYVGDATNKLNAELVSFREETEFDLLFAIQKSKEGNCLVPYFNSKQFSKKEVDRLVQGYLQILEVIANSSKEQIVDEGYLANIKVLSSNEQKCIADFNNTVVEYPKDKCIHQLFEEQAEKNAYKTAVIAIDRTLSYKELQHEINDYCVKLQSLGINQNDVVAVHIERISSLIALQLAVLKTGSIFLPVDKRYPIDRINYMCKDCDVKLFITDEDIKVSSKTIKLDELNNLKTDNKFNEQHNLDSCYIIYTSGSTGQPKGCMLTNKGLVNFCVNNNTLKTLTQRENNVFACVNSSVFDYFIAETLFPLLNGYTTVLFTDEESTNQKKFLEKIEKNSINVLMTTPTRLKLFFSDNNDCSVLKNLSLICTSGEPLTAELLNTMYTKAENAKVYNPLGPSECSVWDLGGELDRNAGLDIHLGKPIANAQVYILNEQLQPTPIGVTGELCIVGDGVGAGYINQPELTAEKFIDNPFGEGKLYKTGDLAYWREDGNVVYVGRNDFQVKVRGLRIELGEIENAINEIDGVESSAVIVKTNDDKQNLCAFYTGVEIDAKAIKKAISSKLPKYMLPNFYQHIDEMPLTSTGKIDRNKLLQFDFDITQSINDEHLPQTEIEKHVCNLFSEILSIENVNLESDFYELGGNSLDLITLMSCEEFENIKVSDFMANPTPNGLIMLLNSSNQVQYKYLESLYIPNNSKRAIILFPFAGGNASGYVSLVNEFKKHNSNITLFYVDWCKNEADYVEIAKEIDILSNQYEVNFYSHCAGSVIAMKLLELLPKNIVRLYIAGAFVPPKMAISPISLWNFVPKDNIIKQLVNVGLDTSGIENSILEKMIIQFRKNTNEHQRYFFKKSFKTKANVVSIVSKYDPFTKNYPNAEKIWNKTFTNYINTIIIDSSSHYFQKDNSVELYEHIVNNLTEEEKI